MFLLFKAGAAFGLAALLTGAVHLDTPRWRAVAAQLHAAHPRALPDIPLPPFAGSGWRKG
jgi:hypothetical protein